MQANNNPDTLSVDIDRKEFALELKTWRLRQELTQQQVADRWGVARFLITRAECAHPLSWARAYRLFNHLSKELRNESDTQ